MDIGLQRAGFDHRFFAEIDPYCRTTLATRFPGVTVYEDVHDVDASAGYVDLLCGGFPCQDISVAGKRAGLAGDRSGLFFEFMRIVDAIRPRAILIENVEGLYSSGSPKGADFGVVLDALAELGYLASWRTLDAQHFGVPQRRRRVFVCAVLDGDPGAERLGEVFAVEQGSSGDSPASDPAWPFTAAPVGEGAGHGGGRVVGALSGRSVTRLDEQCVGGGQIVTASVTAKWAKGSGGPSGDEIQNVVWGGIQRTDIPIGVNPSNSEIAGTLPSNQQGGQRTTDIAGAYVYRKARRAHAVVTSTVRRLTPMECERLMGWPDGWTDVPWRKKDVSPDSRRYAACGNGVVAPVAYWIGARLAEVLAL